jgi:hypothetical protein
VALSTKFLENDISKAVSAFLADSKKRKGGSSVVLATKIPRNMELIDLDNLPSSPM